MITANVDLQEYIPPIIAVRSAGEDSLPETHIGNEVVLKMNVTVSAVKGKYKNTFST